MEGANYRVKGSIFRAHLKYLEAEGKLAAITGKVSPATANLIAAPPLASSWMESAPLDEIVRQLEVLDGMDAVRRIAVATLRDQISPLLVPMVKGIMLVIGGSPPTLYTRMGDLVKTVIRDVEYTWSSTGPKAGTINVRYPNGRDVPLRTFISAIAGFEKILELCNVKGTVSDPAPRGKSSADFQIAWR